MSYSYLKFFNYRNNTSETAIKVVSLKPAKFTSFQLGHFDSETCQLLNPTVQQLRV